MRIISGKYKHRRFDIPKNFNARPTTDFAKENLFNLLNNLVCFENISVLDLFSGTGSITAEFLSRGCPYVTSVEIRKEHYQFILKIISELGAKEHFKLVSCNVLDFIKKNKCKKTFDLIFADPPYQMKELPLLPKLIFQSKLLNNEGLFVLEHPKQYQFSKEKYFFDHRSYGSVNFSFFRYVEDI